MGTEAHRPDDVTHSRRHEDGGRKGFSGGEDLSGREEFAGRENVTRKRTERAVEPGRAVEADPGDRLGEAG
jgi:hypothetical protein